jgi:branched-chain amino acid aminotransferase
MKHINKNKSNRDFLGVMLDIKITKATHLKEKPKDESKLGFGKIFTDHMFTMKYDKKKGGWYEAAIIPYSNIELDPAACGLHYGQLIFEGLKCYNGKKGLNLFRPMKNLERMDNSAKRMCMAPLDKEIILKGMKELIKLDREWVPKSPGTSLYIRPTMIATEPFLGVHPSEQYLFYIILCPVGAYYASGFAPIKIMVEDKYVRAAPGGVGDAKVAGNYAASLKSAEEAQAKGFTQVLWLDARERKYIEEVGTMNMMFVFKNGNEIEVVTSPLTGSILPGVTRDSVLQLLKHWGYKATERMISIDEVIEKSKNGELVEAFGTGTAAVITPVGSLTYKDKDYVINDFKIGSLTQKLYDELTAIQYCQKDDPLGWIEMID